MKKSKMYVVMLLAVMVVCALVGCGMKNSNGEDAEATTGWSVENPDNTMENNKTTEDINDTENTEDGIMNHLGAGTFDTYEDAKNYLKDKLEADHKDISYEFREENEELTAYNSENPGAEGYQFHVYEADGGKKTGDYYVDKDTGKVYLYTEDNKITEY